MDRAMNMLDSDEHEIKRAELFRMVEERAIKTPEAAIAFILWDLVGQTADINKSLKRLNDTLDEISNCLHERMTADE